MNLKSNAKAIVAAVTTFSTWGGTALADGHISAVEWFGLCGVFLAGFSVWAAANAPTVDELNELSATLDAAKEFGAVERTALTLMGEKEAAIERRAAARPLEA